MGDLRRLCEAAGLERVQTYIASHVAILLDGPPPADALNGVVGRNGEDTHLGLREIYVRYGDGMAASKLKILARL